MASAMFYDSSPGKPYHSNDDERSCPGTIPIDAEVSFALPANTKPAAVRLLMSGKKPAYQIKNGRINLEVHDILDHKIIGVNLV